MANGKSGSAKMVLVILASILMIAFFFIDPFPGLEPVGNALPRHIHLVDSAHGYRAYSHLSLLPGRPGCGYCSGCATFDEAFASFASSTAILLIGAFGLATASPTADCSTGWLCWL